MEFLNHILGGEETPPAGPLEFRIPDTVFHRMSMQTQAKKLELFVDMLVIQSSSDVFSATLKNTILEHLELGLSESGNSLRSLDFEDMDFRATILRSAIDKLYIENPMEFLYMANSGAYILVNDISMNIYRYMEGYSTSEIEKTYFGMLFQDLKDHGKIRSDNDNENERRYLISKIGDIDGYESNIELHYNFYLHGYIEVRELTELARGYYSQGKMSYERLLQLEKSIGFNHFIELEENGFSQEITDFIYHDIFPSLCGEDIDCTPDTMENLRQLCLFVMDIETTRGTELKNNQGSSARGYMHLLNQNGRNTDANGDGIPDWNTIDLTLRHSARYYNQSHKEELGLNQYTIFDVENINSEVTPEGIWVKRLWEYNDNNGEGRNGDEFLFDDQVRIFLMRTLYLEPTALKNILLGNNQSSSAATIYRSHHGNVHHALKNPNGHKETEIRMQHYLREYY